MKAVRKKRVSSKNRVEDELACARTERGKADISCEADLPVRRAPEPVECNLEEKKDKAVDTEQITRISSKLRSLQRERSVVLKSRNMQMNRLRAVVACSLGYNSSMEEADREKRFAQADQIIKEVSQAKEGASAYPMASVIKTTMIGIVAFNELKKNLETSMKELVKQLPVMKWVEAPEQRGFGDLFLAIVIGECGDLANYANPGKVWRRMGCAPWQFDGTTAMGSSWGKRGVPSLPAAEWSKFGYSPRRRSIAYLIGKGLMMQNFVLEANDATEEVSKHKRAKRNGADDSVSDTEMSRVGPYRLRYEQAKTTFKEKHPKATDGHCNSHGMLLAAKLLLKNLWIEWRR